MKYAKPHIFFGYILIGFTLLSCNSQELITPESEIQIESGLVSGIAGVDPSITVFKGIPFAAPPIGDLRWKAPQPPTNWNGVREANEFCKSCMQALTRKYMPWTEEYMIANDVSEDCLSLNVWTAAKTKEEKRPVLVYIHGGAYTGGSGEITLYNGEKLAKKGLVVVTVNYRLGMFGFLAHPILSAESMNNSSGNYALLDNIIALEWVKKNIAAFGGDPNNVTISGQSAGAASIHYLTASPLAKGLFHKAIAQSGSWSEDRNTSTLVSAEQKTIDYMAKWGIDSFEELRNMSATELQTLPIDFGNRFVPVNDGWVMPISVTEQFQNGTQNDVPMLMGLNADEGSSSSTYGKMSSEDFKKNAAQRYGDLSNEILATYPSSTDEESGESTKQIARDFGLNNMAKWENIRANKGKSTDFLYYFDRSTPWPEFPQYATFHSSEIPYVFMNQHLIDRPWETVDSELSEMMSDYWVNFITTGNPNGENLPNWSSEKGMMMRFDEEPNSEVILSGEKTELFEKIMGQ